MGRPATPEAGAAPGARRGLPAGASLPASAAAVALAAASAWLLASDRPRPAGAVAIAAAVALVAGYAVARGHARSAFAAELADRLTDVAVLGAIAWKAFDPDPALSAAAVVLLCASASATYVSARARSLGYWASDPALYRGLRVALVGAGLAAGRPAPGLYAAIVLSAAAFAYRWVEVSRQGGKPGQPEGAAG